MLLACWLADRPVGVNEMGRMSMAWGEMNPDMWFVATGKHLADLSTEEITQHRQAVHYVLGNVKIRKTLVGDLLTEGEDVFVKTHSAIAILNGYPTIYSGTKGGIYVVRDPRDVASSYAHHYGFSLDEAIDRMGRPMWITQPGKGSFYQFTGTWSENVESWADAEGVHVIRYEDLHNAPVDTFRGVLRFLGLSGYVPRVKRAIENASFRRLKAEEDEKGFVEASERGTFFRQGKAGGWKDVLSPEQVARIEFDHGAVMRRMGYLGGGAERTAPAGRKRKPDSGPPPRSQPHGAAHCAVEHGHGA